MNDVARKNLPAKLAPPRLVRVIDRPRLFAWLDEPPGRFWISAPGGSGKTTLAATWLARRKLRPVWFQLDEDDADRATFFHYLAIAAAHVAPRHAAELAALARASRGSEPMQFTRNFARRLFAVLPRRSALVFDHLEAVIGHAGTDLAGTNRVACPLQTVP